MLKKWTAEAKARSYALRRELEAQLNISRSATKIHYKSISHSQNGEND
uniref:Uncharacterized protein n=1 Tax=Arundo donax TaxID=35708 RepID=A0A0A8YE36_ARUDO